MDFFQSMCDSLSKIAGKELLNYLNLWILCNSLFIVFSVLSYSIFLWFRHSYLLAHTYVLAYVCEYLSLSLFVCPVSLLQRKEEKD